MSGESGVRQQAGPCFEDEFAGPLGARRLHVEWILTSKQGAFRPPFDVYETERHLVVKVEVAGMREEDFAISLDGRILHISGVRQDTSGKLAYQRMEINYGEFRLDVRLPHVVDQAEIEASYDRGFLNVYVPRRPVERRIPIIDAGES